MGCGSSNSNNVVEPTITRPPTPSPSIRSVDLPDVEDSYPCLSPNSFLTEFLSEELYNRLCPIRTRNGFSLNDIIQTELDAPTEDGFHLVIPDCECYTAFEEFLTPLIRHYHFQVGTNVAKSKFSQKFLLSPSDSALPEERTMPRRESKMPSPCGGTGSDGAAAARIATDLDPEGLRPVESLREEHFLSCEVSTRRSVAEYPAPAFCTRGQRRELFDVLTHALCVSQPDYLGRAALLAELSSSGKEEEEGEEKKKKKKKEWEEEEEEKKQRAELLSCPCQFDAVPGSRVLTSSVGVARDGSEARGTWVDSSRTATAHLNSSDHLHLLYRFAPDSCSGLYDAFAAFLGGAAQLELALQYHDLTLSHHPTLGFLSSSPLHIGASLDLAVTLAFPKLARLSLFDDILAHIGFGVVERGDDLGTFALSYSHCFGASEVEFLQHILNLSDKMAAIEELYLQEENFYHLLPSQVQEGAGRWLANYPCFADKSSTLAKLLTIDTYLRLAPLTTPLGFSLDHALQSGREDPTNSVRFSLSDCSALDVFGEVFNPVIRELLGPAPCPQLPLTRAFPLLLNGGRALGETATAFCYVAVQRNVAQFPFPPHSSSSAATALNDAVSRAMDHFAAAQPASGDSLPLSQFLEENGSERDFLLRRIVGEMSRKGTAVSLPETTPSEEGTATDSKEAQEEQFEHTQVAAGSKPHHRLAGVVDVDGTFPPRSDHSRVWTCTAKEEGGRGGNGSRLTLVTSLPRCHHHLTLVFSREDDNVQSLYEDLLALYPSITAALSRDAHLQYATAEPYGFASSNPSSFGLSTSVGLLLNVPCLSAHGEKLSALFAPASILVDAFSDDLVHVRSETALGEREHDVFQRVVDSAARALWLDRFLLSSEADWQTDSDRLAALTLGDLESTTIGFRHPDFPDLSERSDLLAANLTPRLYSDLANRTTSSGSTINSVIQAGVDGGRGEDDLSPGIVAGDSECYDVFAPLFHPIISSLHACDRHVISGSFVSGLYSLPTGDVEVDSVLRVKIKLRANITDFPFPPNCTRFERSRVESLVSAQLRQIAGAYYPLSDLPRDVSQQLAKRNFSAKEPAFPAFVSSSLIRDWPHGRGVWIGEDGNTAAFVNGEDHICVTSISETGSVGQAYDRLQSVFGDLRARLEAEGVAVATHPKYGVLTTSPAHVGCGLSVECSLHLPLLAPHPWLPRVARAANLKASREGEEGGTSSGSGNSGACSKVSVCSVRSLGLGEREVLVQFRQSVLQLQAVESTLSSGSCLYASPHQPRLLLLPAPISDGTDAANKCNNFPDFSSTTTTLPPRSSPLALTLSADMFERLSTVSTATFGATLEDVIALGRHSPAHPVGVVVCDAECWHAFRHLYVGVLSRVPPGRTFNRCGHKRHSEIDATAVPPPPRLDDKFVGVTYEYRCNLATFPFPPLMTRRQRREVDEILQEVLISQAPGSGSNCEPVEVAEVGAQPAGSDPSRYLSLRHLMRKKELWGEGSRLREMCSALDPSTGMTRDWPWNRGVFLTEQGGGGVVATVNFHNHLALSVTSPHDDDDDIAEGYRKLLGISRVVERELTARDHPVAFCSEDGYLNTCPTQCGSGLRMVCKLRLPKLARHPKSSQILSSLCVRMSKTLLVNEVTGESDNVAEIEFVPGHNLGEEQSLVTFFASLEQLCSIETSLQQSRRNKWSSVPWPAFGTRHVKV